MDRRTGKRLHRAAQAVGAAMFVLDLIVIDYLDYVFVHHRPSKPGGGFTLEYPRLDGLGAQGGRRTSSAGAAKHPSNGAKSEQHHCPGWRFGHCRYVADEGVSCVQTRN